MAREEDRTVRRFLSKEEREEARKNGKRRAQERVRDREHLRLEIDTRQILNRMAATVNTLVLGYEEVHPQDGDPVQMPLSRDRIAALKVASDVDKMLLDRVLPALRPIEVAPHEEHVDPAQMTDNELRQQLAAYLGINKRLVDQATAATEPAQQMQPLPGFLN